MAFDGLTFRRIAMLVSNEVNKARIERIGEVSKTDFVFELFNNGKHISLLISANPVAAHFTIRPKNEHNYLPLDHFTNLLKSHLEGGVIQSFKQLNLDRILEIVISKKDDIGDLVNKKIYVEYLGRMTNIILTKEDDKIIDVLHRMGPNEATKRTLYAGATYKVPPLKTMKDPLIDSYNINETYSTQFYGISTTLEKEWTNNNFSENDIHEFVAKVLISDSIYIGKNKNNLDFHLVPLTLFNKEYKQYSWKEGIEEFYSSILHEKQQKDRGNELLNMIKKEIKKNSKKLINLDQDLVEASQANKYKEYGDLLYQAENLNQNGLKEITINDTNIKLNPELSIVKNANKYFEKYHKLKNASDYINEQKELTEHLLNYFELLQIQIIDADNETLQEIKLELAEKGYIKSNMKTRKKIKTTFNTLHFTSKDGIEIEVGRNNVQNDYLTFKKAKYNEYFFHVKDFPGAHVLVHSINPLSEDTIRLASNLAAYYSKARYSSSVPVNYTIIKNIKKPKNYRLGQVLINEYKTIYIDPKEIKNDKH